MATQIIVKVDGCPILIDEGSQWMHTRKISVYDVLMITNTNADDDHKERFKPQVVFKDAKNNIWSLSPEEFLKERSRI